MDPRINSYPDQQSDTRLQQLHKMNRNPSEESEYQRLLAEAGGASGGTNAAGTITPFNFDWTAAEAEALEKLRPYYEEKLKEAEGDVGRAKQLIEEDYDRGKRYREEDLATQTTADTQTAKEETQGSMEALNRRGVLFGQMDPGQETSAAPISDFAQKFELDPLQAKQQARRQAIQRAISRQEEVAGVEKTRGLQEQDIAFPRYKKALEEEKQEKAVLQMAPLKYQRELTKYNATVGNSSYLQG